MTFDEWLAAGISSGYCGPPVCSMHDGTPTSAEEDDEMEDGSDPCITILRLYEDNQVKSSVEANHSPSQWRMSNMLWGSR